MNNFYEHAIIAQANQFQFPQKWSLSHNRVKSIMLLWSKAGYGKIVSNNKTFSLGPLDFVCLPWGHAIAYESDQDDPFFVGGIHIIPYQAPSDPMIFAVDHGPSVPLEKKPFHKNCPIQKLEQIVKGRFEEHPALLHLAEYTVQLFYPAPPEEWLARLAARQLLYHLTRLEHHQQTESGETPLELLRLINYTREHLSRPITLQQMADLIEKSPATLHRLFQKHLNTTPGQWVANQRIEEAKLLCLTTHLTAMEIADKLGFSDIYHFSKFFKRMTGVSFREYRNRQANTLWT